MKIKKFFIIFFIIILSLNNCYCVKNKLVIGMDANFPPMGFLDNNNEIIGFDIDLAKEVFKLLGIEIEFQLIDWDAKELELETGKIDMLWNGVSKTEERDKIWTLTIPYINNKQVFVVKTNSGFEKISDLSNKTISLQKGSAVADYLKDSRDINKFKNVIELEKMINCLNEVKIGRCEACLADEPVMRYYLKENNLDNDFKIIKEALTEEEYVVAVKKGNIELKNKIEEGLKLISKSGKAADISKKWFGEDITVIEKAVDQTIKENSETKNQKIFYPMLLGLIETLKLFILCLTISLPLGFVICLLRNINYKIISVILNLYIKIMQGTPLLLQIFFIFYGLPFISDKFIIGDRFIAGLIAFILNYAAYFAEIFRGGLKSIDKGQFEAIKVLQISRTKGLLKVILPQVLTVSLPSICNETVTLVKDTALIFSIGIVELLSAAKNIVNSSANIMAYIVAGCIYLIICSFISLCFQMLEKKFNY